jgi:hypothetical protein
LKLSVGLLGSQGLGRDLELAAIASETVRKLLSCGVAFCDAQSGTIELHPTVPPNVVGSSTGNKGREKKEGLGRDHLGKDND